MPDVFTGKQPRWRWWMYDVATRARWLRAQELAYGRWFFDKGDAFLAPLYGALADALHNELQPATVLDVGCGTGLILARLREHGVTIRGIEGSRVAIRRSPVADAIVRADLRNGVPDLGAFDVALCIEVAEHLPPESADVLVAGLADASDVIVFTAAIPGQGGMGHLNEQPPAYWRERFRRHGFELDGLAADLRAAIAAHPEPWWIHQNLSVFRRPR